MIIMYLTAAVIAYFVGAIPFSFLVPKLINGVDIRTVGSKNVGSTNVLRTCGIFSGALAFLLDSTKGAIVLLLNICFFEIHFCILFAFIAILGHCYSVFLGFKGGKGVAASAGIILLLDAKLFVLLLILFILVVVVTRYVSLGSIILASLIAPLHYVFHKNLYSALCLFCIGAFVIYRHKSNIDRLLNGNENKITFRKK